MLQVELRLTPDFLTLVRRRFNLPENVEPTDQQITQLFKDLVETALDRHEAEGSQAS